jgi:plasmid stabilization system protein ParE
VRIIWSPLAESRAVEAFEYIARSRPSAAERWLDRLLDQVGSLASMPDRGRAVPELHRPDVRELVVGPYRLIYRRDPQRVVILTIRHERRQFDPEEVGE